MNFTRATQDLERKSKFVQDWAKRGDVGNCDSTFASLRAAGAKLPANEAAEYEARLEELIARVRPQLGAAAVEKAKKNVQRHLKYAEDAMAKGNAKTVASAKDLLASFMDKCEGKGYFHYHESAQPFLEEVDAMNQKIDAWLAANSGVTPAVGACCPGSAAPPAAAAAPAPGRAAAAAASSGGGTVAPPSQPDYRRLDDGSFLPVFDTSASTGLPAPVLRFLPSMVNAFTKKANENYCELTTIVNAGAQDDGNHGHFVAVHSLIVSKIEQLRKVLPKALAVDASLVQILESEIEEACTKVDALAERYQRHIDAAAAVDTTALVWQKCSEELAKGN